MWQSMEQAAGRPGGGAGVGAGLRRRCGRRGRGRQADRRRPAGWARRPRVSAPRRAQPAPRRRRRGGRDRRRRSAGGQAGGGQGAVGPRPVGRPARPTWPAVDGAAGGEPRPRWAQRAMAPTDGHRLTAAAKERDGDGSTNNRTYSGWQREKGGAFFGLDGTQTACLGVAAVIVAGPADDPLVGWRWRSRSPVAAVLVASALAADRGPGPGPVDPDLRGVAPGPTDRRPPVPLRPPLPDADRRRRAWPSPSDPADEWDLPGVLAPLRLLAAPDGHGGMLAVVHHRVHNTYTAVARVTHPGLALLASAQAQHRVQGWASWLAQACAEDGSHLPDRHLPRGRAGRGRRAGRLGRSPRPRRRPGPSGRAGRRDPGRRPAQGGRAHQLPVDLAVGHPVPPRGPQRRRRRRRGLRGADPAAADPGRRACSGAGVVVERWLGPAGTGRRDPLVVRPASPAGSWAPGRCRPAGRAGPAPSRACRPPWPARPGPRRRGACTSTTTAGRWWPRSSGPAALGTRRCWPACWPRRPRAAATWR